MDVPLRKGRRIIAISGPPASGKSYLADALSTRLPQACVVPMDGFHHSNDHLHAQGMLSRKGAPETFDVAGLASVVKRMRSAGEVPFPTFDRARDRVVPNGGCLRTSDTTVLVEGNYLLFDAPPWEALADLWDFGIVLDVPLAELRERLLKRWLDLGYDSDAATRKTEENDLPNARLVYGKRLRADMVLSG
ncbi:AAA family ATPase [Sulfitobacter sp. HNIBRBA2951]|uniref:AAA family ATPase n=1 Tax=Sulfitobacter aquimarinus TaxID=3158557 RepID=UPI0032DE99C4